MKSYIKLMDKKCNSVVITKDDIVGRKSNSVTALMIDVNKCNELMDLTSTREVLFMDDNQFSKYINGLDCINAINYEYLTLFTKKGVFQASRYIDSNNNEIIDYDNYRIVCISGKEYRCIKMEDSDYNYKELYEFSDIKNI